ncbi:MAG: DnaJ domain-containing protein [Porticoccaceae bacterium]|nr:DnaJ domain-containing protein [Porticoccaceae bacterium]
MEFKDYYKILGVDANADATAIKAAYRKLARKYHPDVSEHHDAENQFKEVAEAYEVLKHPDKRAEYDEIRKYGHPGQSFKPPPGWQPGAGSTGEQFDQDRVFSEFFSSIFGQGFSDAGFGGASSRQRHGHDFHGGGSRRGQDIETDLPIFLEETLENTAKTISYQLGGATKNLKIKIPAGVNDGERIRLKGQGAPGLDGGSSGDLYLRIRLVPHPLFDVEGHNLIITLPLSPWEAALGTKVELPTLSGKVNLSIPPATQGGQRLRIKGKGLIKKDGSHGDLYAVVNIVMPSARDSAINKLWQELADKAAFDPRAEWRNS